MTGSPLWEAVWAGDTDAVRRLLAEGADPARGWDGESPLHAAARRDRADLARLLLEADADPDAKGQGYETPLLIAASRGRAEVVSVLLEHGASPYCCDLGGEFPITAARNGGHTEVVRLLEVVQALTYGEPSTEAFDGADGPAAVGADEADVFGDG